MKIPKGATILFDSVRSAECRQVISGQRHLEESCRPQPSHCGQEDAIDGKEFSP